MSGIEAGVSAIPVFGRHPITVASQARTSQAATGGRFRLGVALGAPNLVEPVFGVRHERPVARLRRYLDAGATELIAEVVAESPADRARTLALLGALRRLSRCSSSRPRSR